MHFIMITFLDGTGSLQEQQEPQQEGQRGVGSVHGGGVTCAGVSLPGYCGPLSSLLPAHLRPTQH